MSNEAIVNFGGGEVTKELDARSDIEKYDSSCRTLQNMIPDVYGNASRRPGTERIISGPKGAGCYYPAVVPDPAKIQIYTVAQLQAINDDLAGDYEIMNDINLEGISWTQLGSVADFTGSLDGNNFIISNLTMLRGEGDYAGLFRNTDSATLIHIHLRDFVLQGNYYMAPLCNNADTTLITHCSATGSITGSTGTGFFDNDIHHAAGLIVSTSGTAAGAVNNCWTDVTITGGSANARISTVGGLIGTPGGGAGIQDCYTRGSIILVGTVSPWIGSQVGAFVGNGTQFNDIKRCYSIGSVPQVYPGNLPTLIYVMGDEGGDAGKNRQPFGGATIQRDDTTYEYNYWDGEAAGTPPNPPYTLGPDCPDEIATEKTTAEMYAEATFETWDFDNTWEIVEGVSYPTLRLDGPDSDFKKRRDCEPI